MRAAHGDGPRAPRRRRRPASFVPPTSTPMTHLAATAATISGDGSRPAAAGGTRTSPRAIARIAPVPGSSSAAARRRSSRCASAPTSASAPRQPAAPCRPAAAGEPAGGRAAGGAPRLRRVLRWVARWRSPAGSALSLVPLPVQRAVPPGPRRRRDALGARVGRRADRRAVDGADPRLRRAAEGLARAGRADERPRPLGLDPADARRRRPQREALDPARHGRRHPRLRPRTRSTPPTRSAGPRSRCKTVKHYLGIDDQPRDPRQLRQVPGAGRRDGRRRLHAAAASSRASTAAFATAATRCGCSAGTTHIDGKQALALVAHAQEPLQPRARTT